MIYVLSIYFPPHEIYESYHPHLFLTVLHDYKKKFYEHKD